jgi:hypothetical protein
MCTVNANCVYPRARTVGSPPTWVDARQRKTRPRPRWNFHWWFLMPVGLYNFSTVFEQFSSAVVELQVPQFSESLPRSACYQLFNVYMVGIN